MTQLPQAGKQKPIWQDAAGAPDGIGCERLARRSSPRDTAASPRLGRGGLGGGVIPGQVCTTGLFNWASRRMMEKLHVEAANGGTRKCVQLFSLLS